jgi:GoLoco motif
LTVISLAALLLLQVKDDADLFDLICRSQSRRIDDQRCSLRLKNDAAVKPLNLDENRTALPPASNTATSDKQLDERFFDMLIRSQVTVTVDNTNYFLINVVERFNYECSKEVPTKFD